MKDETNELIDDPSDDQPGPLGAAIYWISGGPLLDLERWFVGPKQRERIRQEAWNAWPLLLVSTAFIGAACWVLVHA